MTSKSAQRILDLDAPLKGATELCLVVADEESNNRDRSDCLERKLIVADGSLKDLPALKWEDANAGAPCAREKTTRPRRCSRTAGNSKPSCAKAKPVHNGSAMRASRCWPTRMGPKGG
jgi:hypothetical protein